MHEFSLSAATALLARTPHVLDAWLRGLGQEWTAHNEGTGTWSPYDVVGHLIHGERTDWIPRLRSILEHGEQRTFAPFDREGMFAASAGRALDGLLDEFRTLRTANLAVLAAAKLSAADLGRRGRHPRFGPVTLRELLATWVVHGTPDPPDP